MTELEQRVANLERQNRKRQLGVVAVVALLLAVPLVGAGQSRVGMREINGGVLISDCVQEGGDNESGSCNLVVLLEEPSLPTWGETMEVG